MRWVEHHNMIELITITSLYLYGTKVLWQPGMVLEGVKGWLDTIIRNRFLSKPLYVCPACMASIWGTAIWILFHPKGWDFWIGWPFFCISVCGLTWILLTNFPFDD